MSEETTLQGLVELTNEEYHQGPGISKSQLDAIAISPLNYWDKYVNPDREPEEQKHCLAVGSGTHTLVLEPDKFEATFGVGFDKSAYPDALNTADDMKQELAKNGLMVSGSKPELARRLVEEAGVPRERILMYLEADYNATLGDRIVIPARDYKDMLGLLQAIDRHPWAGALVSGAYVEQSYFHGDVRHVIDHATGQVIETFVLRKCRPDIITSNGEWIVDLKTTQDVSLNGFGASIARYRYEVQAAWYLDILRDLYGSDAPRGFAFIACQKSRPYDVAVHYLTPEQIDRGRFLYKRDLERLLVCQHNNYWPGADNGDLLQARLPYWAEREYLEAKSSQ